MDYRLHGTFFRIGALEGRYLHLLGSAVFTALATFSKEQGVTVLGVAAAYEVFAVQKFDARSFLQALPTPFAASSIVSESRETSPKHRKTRRRRENDWLAFPLRMSMLFAVGLAVLALRFRIMGSTLPVFTVFDNPASYSPSPTRQLTYAYLVAVNLGLLINPDSLCCDWTMGTIPLIQSFHDWRNLTTATAFAGLLAVGLVGLFDDDRRRRAAVLVSLAAMAVPFLPASNLFFPVGFVVAERVLYLPSMGFCLLVAIGLGELYSRVKNNMKIVLRLTFFLTLAFHSTKCIDRNWDWVDEYSLFLSGLKVNAGNAKLFNNVGHALEAQSKHQEALAYFQRAAFVQSDDIGAHINVGRALAALGRDAEAEQAYFTAKNLLPKGEESGGRTARVAPQHLSVFLNLASLIAKDPSRLEEADHLYRQAIAMRNDYVQAYINRGDVLLRMNRTSEALAVYESALAHDSNNADIHYNLGVVRLQQQQQQPQQDVTSALAHFDAALNLDPDHSQSLINSAIIIQESGKANLRPIAYKVKLATIKFTYMWRSFDGFQFQRLLRAMELQPENDRVYFNLGMLAMDDGNAEDAEKWFKKAISLKPNFRSALFNLALLLTEQNRPLESVPHLRALLSAHPGHVKGLTLLGDVLTNHVRDLDGAEECYRRILLEDPGHSQAAHNLCVVQVERGQLEAAAECLRAVAESSPELDYVAKHLAIVEERIRKKKEQKP